MALTLNTNMMALNTSRNLGNHYSNLSTSVRRLSSGLRVSTAADDAAGLAIRELMRADIAALNQGIRNANDAISLIQTADGALGIIDEKLIRMKELSEQAATGTYNSDQRLMIDSEFQAMAAEIDRIAKSTEFNGVKLLDGSLKGRHDGSGLVSTGALKVHFGTGNDSAEDYYYLNIGDATLFGLGLSSGGRKVYSSDDYRPGDYGYYEPMDNSVGSIKLLWATIENGGDPKWRESGIYVSVIPQGTKNLSLHLNDANADDTFQLFTLTGEHIVGTELGTNGWSSIWHNFGGPPTSINPGDEERIVNRRNGFDLEAAYDASNLNGIGGNVPFTPGTAGNVIEYNGMTIGYSGHGDPNATGGIDNIENEEYLTIDETTEDLILVIVGGGVHWIDGSWDFMPYYAGGVGFGETLSIRTQELAQGALDRLDDAIIAKDKIRAHLGAMQNRLENTVSNLQIQAENLQAAESRISDVDVATEMTEFARAQILTQAATAMLSQANSMPQMALSLMG